jgi:hypothetical protein
VKTALIIGGGAVALYVLWQLAQQGGASFTAAVSGTGAYTPAGNPPGVPYANVPTSDGGVTAVGGAAPSAVSKTVTVTIGGKQVQVSVFAPPGTDPGLITTAAKKIAAYGTVTIDLAQAGIGGVVVGSTATTGGSSKAGLIPIAQQARLTQ